MKIVLGTSSKWRRAVMNELNLKYEVMAPDIDEKAIRHDDPEKLVVELAKAKAEALLPQIKEPALLITADQVVTCNSQIREKPESEKEARDFLRSYARHPAETISSVAVTNTKTGKQCIGVDIVKIYFRPFTEEGIDKIIKKGDVFFCAGGFAIEQPEFRPFLDRVEGTTDSTSGLPKKILLKLLEKCGAGLSF